MDISELQRVQQNREFLRHPWEIARCSAISFLLKKRKSRYKRILDIGSGDAFVINKLAEDNISDEYIAVDTAYTPEIIEALNKKRINENISFRNSSPKNTNTDCILLLDVLEHCEDDRLVLHHSIEQNTVPGDCIILITVPAFQGLFSQHDILLGHHRRYSRRQLRRLVKNENLEILEQGYFFFSLLPVRLFQLLLEKMKIRKAKNSIDNWNGGKAVSKIISTILWADFRMCRFLSRAGIHLPGLSCYCLCKKSPS